MTDHAKKLAEALRDAVLQLDYLQTFQRRGSTASVVASCRRIIASYEIDQAKKRQEEIEI